MLEEWAYALAESRPRELAVYLLGNVPGLPPIVQTVHILGIAVVMASVVMIDLRFLGIAVKTQSPSEMIGRLMPWMWVALASNLLTGMVFVVARPLRYYFNPIFSIKLSLLAPAVGLALVLHRLSLREADYWERSPRRLVWARVIAVMSLILWTGVILAGRWIAYSDYIFFVE